MLVYCWLTLERKYGGYTSKQYEIVVDRAVVEAPNFNNREIFSPETLYRWKHISCEEESTPETYSDVYYMACKGYSHPQAFTYIGYITK